MRSLVIGAVGLLAPVLCLGVVIATAPRGEAAKIEKKATRRPKAPSRIREVKSPVDSKLYAAAAKATDEPENPDAQAMYALLLAQKAREVGNAAYHVMAEKAARKALEKAPRHELARSALAVALCGQHRFADALALVRSLPGPSTVWRLACETDALSELGRYEEAVQVAQRLVDLKPGPESYSRVALLREIHGDPEGALEAWGQALGACPAKSLDHAWCAAQAGDVQVRRGDFAAAQAAYEDSLAALPDFFLARLGLARCAVARGRLGEAQSLLDALAETHGDVPTLALLSDVEAALGDDEGAAATMEQMLAAERFSAQQGAPDPRGLANFLVDHERDPAEAVKLLATAGGPTVVNEDARAWALLAAGRPQEAREHMRLARRTNTHDPRVLFHAGAIELALGEREAGRALIEAALAGGLRADLASTARAKALLESARS